MIDKDKTTTEYEIPIADSNYIFYPLIVLGRGQFGTVYKGKHTKTNEYVAIKHMIITSEDMEASLKRETAFMRDKELQLSPNIIKCYDIYIKDKNYYIITELCDCSLNEYIRKTQLTENESLSLMYNIIQGYITMRKRNVIHRDLKPENILIKGKIPKIADFGSAREKSAMHTEDVGTLFFKAPEILEGDNDYDDLIDMWSLGITLYYMIYRDYPFKSKGFSQSSMLQEIKKNHMNILKKDLKIRSETQNLLTKMLQIEKDKRIKWSQIESHTAFDFLKKKDKEKNKEKDKDKDKEKEKPHEKLVDKVRRSVPVIANSHNLEVPVPNSNCIFFPFMVLSRSNNGAVYYKGVDKKKGKDVAVQNFTLDADIHINLNKEISIYKDSEIKHHENILKYYDIAIKDKNCYLISELYECSLNDYLRAHHIKESEALSIVENVSKGYIALRKKHVKNICLRPESILIKKKISKIADFGKIKISLMEDQGYLSFKAPETLEDPNMHDDISDIWSLGVMFYYMIYRELPYKPSQSISQVSLLTEIKKIGSNIFGKKEGKVSQEVQNLISKMLEINRDQRIKWDALHLHNAFEQKRSRANTQDAKDTKTPTLNGFDEKLITSSQVHIPHISSLPTESRDTIDLTKHEKTTSLNPSIKMNIKRQSIIIDDPIKFANPISCRHIPSIPDLNNKTASSPGENKKSTSQHTSDSPLRLNLLPNDNNDNEIFTIDMTKKESNMNVSTAPTSTSLTSRGSTVYIPGNLGDNFTTGHCPVLVDSELKKSKGTTSAIFFPNNQKNDLKPGDSTPTRVVIMGFQDYKESSFKKYGKQM